MKKGIPSYKKQTGRVVLKAEKKRKVVTAIFITLMPLISFLQNGICWSSDCLCGPRGPRLDRGDRMLRCPTLEGVLLHRIQHCDSSGNDKLKKNKTTTLIMKLMNAKQERILL